eukprot:g4581.t1
MAAITDGSSTLNLFYALQDALDSHAYRSAVAIAQSILLQSPLVRTPLKSEGNGALIKPGSVVLTMELLADAHVGLKEYHRAVNYYTQAEKLLTRKVHPTIDGSSGLNLGGVVASPGIYTPKSNTSARNNNTSNIHFSTKNYEWKNSSEAQRVYDILFKCSQAYICLKNERQAMIVLEKIPDKQRSNKVTLALANLYATLGSSRAAISAYKIVWKANPYIIESAKKLIDLNVAPEEVINMVERFFEKANVPWLESLIVAYGHEVNHRPKKGLEVLDKLGTGFHEKNTVYLLQRARLYALMRDNNTAVELFNHAHMEDETSFTDMDVYARVLYEQNDNVRLNRLTQKLLQMNDARVEGWISAAYYSLLKRNYDKALGFIEQATEISLRCYNAYICKGEILMARGREKQHVHMEAINAFKRAWGLKRGILACKGLVQAFLKDGNAGQAKGFARDARTNMPDSADSWVLLGSVYAHLGQKDSHENSENFEKAKRAFRKALTLDPLSMDATYQTVNVLVFEKAYVPAIELLKKSLGHCNDHIIHTELAKVYIKNADYGFAIEHCQHALAYSPQYEDAKEAFDRAERGLKGLDPDGDHEDENEGDDGGDDSF